MNINKEVKKSLVREVKEDFERRREAQRSLQTKWLLNINFMLGNQHSQILPNGDITTSDRRFYWQEFEVYNHIAPIIENRLAKFTRVNSSVNVRPSSASDEDVNSARLSAKLIESVRQDNNFVYLQNLANYWSELTGTAFYKVTWSNKNKGDVNISVCPPYEIYPDSLNAQDMDGLLSIIHAKAYPIQTIMNNWGVEVAPEQVSVISTDSSGKLSGKPYPEPKKGYAIVIERYLAPSKENPKGRLTIVSSDTLLFDGDLPYKNGKEGTRAFPFIRQIALEQPSSFFGMSLIERLIPVQRAYNAVKNRKHEFLNRLTTGVIAVEDGSVDVESLEDEGLSPGKVIIYRQGSNPPLIMSAGSVPAEFRDEENRLLSEFVSISGISNYVSSNSLTQNNISGYALSLLLEQDYSRLSVTTESIRNAIREMSKHILRLFRQFSSSERMLRISENGELMVKAFKASDLTSDDIILEADSEMVETPAVRRSMVMELVKNGLLSDENGRLTNRNRLKVLEMLGFGNWENARSNDEAHLKKAELENVDLTNAKEPGIEEVDDHDLHVSEHIKLLVLGRDSLSDKAKKLTSSHIRQHKVLKRLSLKADAINYSNLGGK